ncbi:prepilin-type N-terminal cleavage/methylation domain-containing protein [bacterium]|nr:MAG: prepilin-type N-terminal cleavage/methylation domain-containing protein [bacterium]
MKRYRGRALQSGFTLIETIVSVSLFASAMTGIAGVYLSVQRLNQVNTSMQAIHQNGQFILEDLTKIIRNGAVDYARYGASVPQPSSPHLYLLDQNGVQVDVYQSGANLVINKTGAGSTNYNGQEVTVLIFKAYIWPATNPFPGGTEQPTVTIFLNLQANVNGRDKSVIPFQTTVATRQYIE